jgi:hypothetical protein
VIAHSSPPLERQGDFRVGPSHFAGVAPLTSMPLDIVAFGFFSRIIWLTNQKRATQRISGCAEVLVERAKVPAFGWWIRTC